MKKPRGMDEKGGGEGNGGLVAWLLGCLVAWLLGGLAWCPWHRSAPLGEAACRFYAASLHFTLAT